MAGRPKFDFTDKILKQVESLAAQGLSQDQIGSVIGCCQQTIIRHKKDNVDFVNAINRGKNKGVAIITNALFESAKGGNLGAQIFFLKNRAGWRDKQDLDITEHKPYQPKPLNEFYDPELRGQSLEHDSKLQQH